MAIMVPDILPGSGPGMFAEAAFYEALKAGLPDEYFVYHGLNYLEGSEAKEGESDFLILHREHGILVIECKGKGVKRTGRGQWFRTLEDGKEWPLKESPFHQALRTVKDLVKELDSRLKGVMPEFTGGFPFVHGHAVAFPLSYMDEVNLPLEAQRAILFDAKDMDRIGGRVIEAYGFWKRRRPSRKAIEKHVFKRFRKRVLHPNLSITDSLGARLKLNQEAFIRLAMEQVLVLKGVLGNTRLRVVGGAGTGKTVLALEAAKMLAGDGKRVLFMCYNQALSRFLDDEVENWGAEGGHIDVHTFHGLCRKAYEELDEPFVVPPRKDTQASAIFWNEAAPLKLMEALDKKRLFPWDAVVIDEGQDFVKDWWVVIEECLKDKGSGSIIVFYDPNQIIFGHDCHVPEIGAEFRLHCKFRNTQAISIAS